MLDKEDAVIAKLVCVDSRHAACFTERPYKALLSFLNSMAFRELTTGLPDSLPNHHRLASLCQGLR